MTTAPLEAALELKTEQPLAGEPIWVRMTITNATGQEVIVVSPDAGTPSPDLNWSASPEAYRIAVLMSFGLFEITLTDALGNLIESKGLMPWVTPILGKRTLQPRESFSLEFDLKELFSINSAGRHRLRVRYGDSAAQAEASMVSRLGRTRSQANRTITQ